MAGSIFSTSWYKVEGIKPRLRSHVQVHKHWYRSREWYVLQDHSTGKFHRFSPEAYYIIGLMDGEKTLDEIWNFVCEKLGDDMPTQDEVIGLISGLYRADVLKTNILPDAADLFRRYTADKRNRLLNMLRSPTSLKFPMFDPDRFLKKTSGFLRPVFSRWGALLWVAVVVPAVIMAVLNWRILTTDMVDRVLSLENLVLIWCIYPVLKLIHEFAHGFAVKRWGGEVHEMGIMLLVFIPIPYVDASSATAFENKWQRMLVGAVGILTELFVAAIALFVWLNVPHGDVRAVAYNVMILAGVSTLFFNGNPLLRFDAYYVLADFLEIPNLASRGNQFIGYLFRRHLLSIREAVSPADSTGEAIQLGIYAVLAFIYRIFITIRIILWIAGSFMVIGVLLAIWSGFSMLVLPVTRIIRLLNTDAALVQKRSRVYAIMAAVFAGLLLFLGFIPVPHHTVAQGVAWPPDNARIYAHNDGYIKTVAAPCGRIVKTGDLLLVCENEELTAEATMLRWRLEELKARHMQAYPKDKIEAKIIDDEIALTAAELLRAQQKIDELTINSPGEGFLALPNDRDLEGRFVKRGEPLGFVLDAAGMTVKIIIPQSAISQVSAGTRNVVIRTASRPGRVLPAEITRIIPAASRDLPSLALSLEGGGAYALDPREKERPKAIGIFFQVELKPLEKIDGRIGERVYVRFHHPAEPLVYRWAGEIRRLLMARFDF